MPEAQHAGPPPFCMLCFAEGQHFADRPGAGDEPFEQCADRRVVPAFGWRDQEPPPSRRGLTVEGALTARARSRSDTTGRGSMRRRGPQAPQTRPARRTRACRTHGFTAHGDHVVVEHAGVDRIRVLLCEQRAPARRGGGARPLPRLARLPTGKRRRRRSRRTPRARRRTAHAGALPALQTACDWPPFVAEPRRRQWIAPRSALVGEDRCARARRGRRLDRAMEMRRDSPA